MGMLDLLLHVDKHLAALVASAGPWTYVLLFAVIFAETGLVVDAVPARRLAALRGRRARGHRPAAARAAVRGAGRRRGARQRGQLLGRQALAHHPRPAARRRAVGLDPLRSSRRTSPRRTILREARRQGGGARPVRANRPHLPAVRRRRRGDALPRLHAYNVSGGALWVGLCAGAGYAFGNIPVVKNNFELVILGIVVRLGAADARRAAADARPRGQGQASRDGVAGAAAPASASGAGRTISRTRAASARTPAATVRRTPRARSARGRSASRRPGRSSAGPSASRGGCRRSTAARSAGRLRAPGGSCRP